MKRALLTCLALFCAAAVAGATEFAPPVRLMAGGKAIRVESPGYAAPCWVDIDGEWTRANLLGQLILVFGRNDQRLAIRPFQDLRFAKRSILVAVEHLKQARHVVVHARVRTGKNVENPVAVNVHELWSGRRASPNTRHFGNLTLRFLDAVLAEICRPELT